MKVSELEFEDDYTVVEDSMTILEISRLIRDTGLPDIIVTDKKTGAVMGALDDFDIVSKVVAEERLPLETTAKDVMYSPPPVHPETDLKRVVEIIENLKINMLPVVDANKKLIGVITIADVLERIDISKNVSPLV